MAVQINGNDTSGTQEGDQYAQTLSKSHIAYLHETRLSWVDARLHV
jgi:hypothetical protein